MDRPAGGGLLAPPLHDLPGAVAAARPWLTRAAAARGRGFVNVEGGDVGSHGSHRSVVRHVANYLAAAELAEALGLSGRVLDVGSGVGGLGAWLAERLGAELHLVDRDPRVRAVATAAFPAASVHADLDATPPAALVTAMEVVEHIRPPEQVGFVAALLNRVAPGGLLVVSTPDETGYLGGWSGYAPHIGPLAADALSAVLQAGAARARLRARPAASASGAALTVEVWRLEGAPFRLGPVRRIAEPIANRVWARLHRRLPALSERLAGLAAAVGPGGRPPPPVPTDVRAVAPAQGTGSGLLGAVRAPSSQA